jgi:type IV pilus assembly protein PilE
MGILGTQKEHRKGFTVVELIIVIVVIAILASIVLFAYPSYQMRSRNNERKSDLTQLAAALNTYALRKNDYMGDTSNCGFLNTGNGWATFTNPGWYDKSITKCLEEAGVLKLADDILDPSGCRSDSGGKCGSGSTNGTATTAPTTAYMKALCTKGGKKVVYVMAYLEGEPRKDAEVDALCDANTMTFFNSTSQKWGTNYGMNYYVKVL